MIILGISAFYHDAAAAILIDGHVIAAAQEERFSRIKNDASFPTQAITFCLKKTGKTIDELDAVIFYDKPFIKFERLLETYYNFSPKGLVSFVTALPIWIKEKLFFKSLIKKSLKKVEKYNSKQLKLLFSDHHLSHAASAYYASTFNEAAILTIDAAGEWATTTLYKAEGNNITKLKQNNFPHSVGLLYSAFTYFLGFRVNAGEYKLMGLAPYGNLKEAQVFIDVIYDKLLTVHDDGSIWLNQAYFNYSTGLRMIKDKTWEKLFALAKRNPEEEITPAHCQLAFAIQHVVEDIVIKQAKHLKEITGAENLCMAGGVALNCVANGKLLQAGIFKKTFIQPAAGDAGGALGATYVAAHIYFKEERVQAFTPYLGPCPTANDVQQLIKKYNCEGRVTTASEIAQLLAAGHIIGRCAGNMEFGPRALGNRSILADPRNPEMQQRLNLHIKYRESFRPFAPAVLAEKAQQYFEACVQSPYMLFTFPIKKNLLQPIPINYEDLGMREKLYTERSTLPAITHVDFSARVHVL